MIAQHTLTSNRGSRKRTRRVGRGDSSGRGSFSGKGCKGQSARSGGKVKPGFEGGQTPLLRRMPKFKGFKNARRLVYQAVNVEKLNIFEEGMTIDESALFKAKLISSSKNRVKILGDGDLTKKLHVRASAFSSSAKQKIEAKGGTTDKQ